MSATTVQLLHAAADVVGGNAPLSRELGIGEKTLCLFLSDSRELPDALLLRAVDIILADRQAQLFAGVPAPGLQTVREISENLVRGNGATRATREGGGEP